MARKPRKTIMSDADISKLRDIEAYTHDDKKRVNNPPVGMAQHDKAEEKVKTYQYDPHIDPTLQWAGKAEGMTFDVPTSSIHIHESIKPHEIIRNVQAITGVGEDSDGEWQMSMFSMLGMETPLERMKRRQAAIQFYQHGVDWTNRLIAGDSLVIMNSLLEKEGMAGQVQMVYIDPPYGIKYGSNFQPFVDKRDVKEKDDDLTQEPEMIKAFRDTWEIGLHSYLSYLKNRLLLARELLSNSGSVFVQISDDNVHHVRELCDEIFGATNFASMISFQKSGGTTANGIERMNDYILWYAKNKSNLQYFPLYTTKESGKNFARDYRFLELPNGEDRLLTKAEQYGITDLPAGSRRYRLAPCNSQHFSETRTKQIIINGKTLFPGNNRQWSIDPEKFEQPEVKKRLVISGNSLMYKMYADEVPGDPLKTMWLDTAMAGLTDDKIYVVQTNQLVIRRCMLMTTEPGDLVLDITCGSGTTAYVAEQWGRRWITCDTSRVAITLAKQRLMTATFDYYKLAHEEQGVGSGFVYKTVPHITLKSIANNEPPATETLYDQPEVDKTKVRITGPFTVEALPAPVVRALDDVDDADEDMSAKQTDWRDQLRATGIMGRGGARLEFSRVEPLSGTKYLQAEAETKEDKPRRAVICFAGETKPLDSRMVAMALEEVERLHPTPQLVIFAAFQFDPDAASFIEDAIFPNVTLLKAQMNTDLMTDDLKKKRSSDQSFWLVGQPDVELIRDGRSKKRFKVKVRGYDYYDVKAGKVDSGTTANIAMWMLDTDYDGMCIAPKQVFFPMGGSKDGWNKLAKTLKAEINQELIGQYAGCESLWFVAEPGTRIAVKIIDNRGIESMKVIRLGDE